MKRRSLLACFALLVMMSVTAYEVENSVFIPPSYYVGDRVELRLTLNLRRDGKLMVSELPDVPQVEIHDILIHQDGHQAEVRIFFSSFQVGSQTLPQINLGAILLDGLRVHTSSLLAEDKQEISALQGQAVLPDTPLVVVITFGIILAVPLFIWLIRRKIVPLFTDLGLRVRQYWPYHQLLSALRKLDAAAYESDMRDFYFRLSREFRLFLSRVLPAVSMTASSSEISRVLEKQSLTPVLTGLIARLLLQFDAIKFGGKVVSDIDKKRDLEKIKTVAEKIRAALNHEEG